jgi:hypothetical protein
VGEEVVQHELDPTVVVVVGGTVVVIVDPLDILKVVVVEVIGGHLDILRVEEVVEVENHVKILGGVMSKKEVVAEEEATVVETVVVPVATEEAAADTAVEAEAVMAAEHPDAMNVASTAICAPTNVWNDNSLKKKFNKLLGLILMPMIIFLSRRVDRIVLLRLMCLMPR